MRSPVLPEILVKKISQTLLNILFSLKAEYWHVFCYNYLPGLGNEFCA
jgi:hypothetical protein